MPETDGAQRGNNSSDPIDAKASNIQVEDVIQELFRIASLDPKTDFLNILKIILDTFNFRNNVKLLCLGNKIATKPLKVAANGALG
jgi:hypothetical protein